MSKDTTGPDNSKAAEPSAELFAAELLIYAVAIEKNFAGPRRRFVRYGTGDRAEGATIIEVSISENPPWYSSTGRIWWLSSDPYAGIREVKAKVSP
jgi:hypothetical protein